MDRSQTEDDRQHEDGLSWFEKFVEASYKRVSQAPFFFLCVAVVAAWLVSAPLWVDLDSWQVAIHTVNSVVTLLLLVLLENASRRAEEAADVEAVVPVPDLTIRSSGLRFQAARSSSSPRHELAAVGPAG